MEKLNDENLDLSLKHILNKDSYKTIFYGQHIMSSNNKYIYMIITQLSNIKIAVTLFIFIVEEKVLVFTKKIKTSIMFILMIIQKQM